MRLTLTLLILCSFATISFAQINGDSPFPVDFEVLAPADAVGIYDYGTPPQLQPTTCAQKPTLTFI